jgi:uncharacterized protein Veg
VASSPTMFHVKESKRKSAFFIVELRSLMEDFERESFFYISLEFLTNPIRNKVFKL